MKHCVEKFGCKGSHIFWEKLFWSSSQVPISKWRQRNHLPPLSELSTTTMTGHFGVIKHLHIPVLNCFSEHVIPKPFDWPKQNIITGYIRSKGGCERAHDQMQIPQHILILRKQSRHTVYVGFGSACRSLKEPAQVLLSVLEGIAAAFHDSTCAVMVQSALVKLADISKDGIKATAKANGLRIEVVDYLPFGTLLPLVDIAFHHGGAGTFASCLQAGCTQIIIPLEFDNFFWGERAHALGVGPEPLMAAEMKTSDVIESLRTARSDAALEKARSIQQKIQEEEDGTDVICRKILSEMDLGI
jgi:sterol 3beta-glucosyltransferase